MIVKLHVKFKGKAVMAFIKPGMLFAIKTNTSLLQKGHNS